MVKKKKNFLINFINRIFQEPDILLTFGVSFQMGWFRGEDFKFLSVTFFEHNNTCDTFFDFQVLKFCFTIYRLKEDE